MQQDNNMVKNQKTEIPQTPEMNDRDFLNDVLESEKNISNNLAIALNEASNDVLFQDILDMFIDCKKMARQLYNLMFQNGWYTLEKAEQQKITQKSTELSGRMQELQQ
ncbi:MAG: spore coat protein [Ignavibacteriales bacterium]